MIFPFIDSQSRWNQCNLFIKSIKIKVLCFSDSNSAGHKKAVLRRLFALLQRTRFKRRQVALAHNLPGW